MNFGMPDLVGSLTAFYLNATEKENNQENRKMGRFQVTTTILNLSTAIFLTAFFTALFTNSSWALFLAGASFVLRENSLEMLEGRNLIERSVNYFANAFRGSPDLVTICGYTVFRKWLPTGEEANHQ